MTSIDTAVALFDHYEKQTEPKHYYGLLAIYALARAAAEVGDDELWARCETILRRFPDDVDHPAYNFPSYRIGGIAQAFLVALGRMPERANLVREYADEIMNAPRDLNGIVCDPRQPRAGRIWIDVAMAVCPYLLYAGLALGERRYLDEAVRQAVLMYDELVDSRNGLVHQCKNFVAPGAVSQDHWGRGNGWAYFALAELVGGLPSEHPGRPDVEERFRRLTVALLPHQSRRGLWRQEIPEPLTYEESSATGLILYGLGVGQRSGMLDINADRAFTRGIHGLLEVCVNDDFSIERSCPGTLCPGEDEERGTVIAYATQNLPYRDEPHGCGPIMLALTQAAQATAP